MVRPATHSPFAAHRESPPAPAADHAYTGAHPDARVRAVAPIAAIGCLGGRFLELLASHLATTPGVVRVPRPPVGDSDKSVPTPDASAATTTSARLLPCCARPPQPTTKT